MSEPAVACAQCLQKALCMLRNRRLSTPFWTWRENARTSRRARTLASRVLRRMQGQLLVSAMEVWVQGFVAWKVECFENCAATEIQRRWRGVRAREQTMLMVEQMVQDMQERLLAEAVSAPPASVRSLPLPSCCHRCNATLVHGTRRHVADSGLHPNELAAHVHTWRLDTHNAPHSVSHCDNDIVIVYALKDRVFVCSV